MLLDGVVGRGQKDVKCVQKEPIILAFCAPRLLLHATHGTPSRRRPCGRHTLNCPPSTMTKTTTATATAANAAASSGIKRKSEDIAPSCDPLTNLALQFPGAALRFVRHLPAKDTLTLQTVNRPFRRFLTDHEDALFKKFLGTDYHEGGSLIKAVENHSNTSANNGDDANTSRPSTLTFKRLYLAFQKRYRLDRTPENHVGVPLTTQLYSPESKLDVDKLVFIARVGTHSATMKWVFAGMDLGDRLVLKSKVGFSIGSEDLQNTSKSGQEKLFPVTLHCIDVERCTSMTIMDSAPASAVELLDDNGGVKTFGHGCCRVYGFPPHGIYREDDPDSYGRLDSDSESENSNYGMDTSMEKFWEYDEDQPCGVESCTCFGFLTLVGLPGENGEKSGGRFEAGGKASSLRFDFAPGNGFESPDSTDRASICTLYRAVMEDKCK